jgi:hypothetical protein
VVRGCGYVVYIQTEEDRGDQTTPAHMTRRDDVAVRKDAPNVRPRRYDEMV